MAIPQTTWSYWELTTRHGSLLLSETRNRSLTGNEVERCSALVEFIRLAIEASTTSISPRMSDIEIDTLGPMAQRAVPERFHEGLSGLLALLESKSKGDANVDTAPVEEFLNEFNRRLQHVRTS